MVNLDVLRHAIERLSEDVSLTDDLIDDAAKALLDWGVAQAKIVAQQEEMSPEKLGARLADLRRTLKRVSKQAGQAAPEEQVAQVQALLLEGALQKKDPEVDKWCASRRDQYHLS